MIYKLFWLKVNISPPEKKIIFKLQKFSSKYLNWGLLLMTQKVKKLLVYENPAEPRVWGCCDHAAAFLSWLCYHLPSAVPIPANLIPESVLRLHNLPITMEKQSAVVFRNVGQMYFPQTRVECHYSLTSGHRWSSSDWIGIFQVESIVSAPFPTGNKSVFVRCFVLKPLLS